MNNQREYQIGDVICHEDDYEDNYEDNYPDDDDYYEDEDDFYADEINYTITSNNVSFAFEGEMYSYSKTKENFDAICKALLANDLCSLRNEINAGTKNITFLNGKIFTKHGVLCICSYGVEHQVDDRLYDRLCKLLNENEDIRPMINFIDRLYKNPNVESIHDMFRFLTHNELPITEDGCFVAYKKVRDTYMDIHSNSMRNKVGDILEMPRENVEFDRETTCSSGLHFCSKDYLPQFSSSGDDRIMILKIDPADVVSIPTDYNNAKGRTCRYEVIDELTQPGDNATVQDKIEAIESKSIYKIIGNWVKNTLGI